MSNADATTNRANLWPLAPSVDVGLSCESVIPHKSSDDATLKIKSWLKIPLSKYVLVVCHPKIQFWPETTIEWS